MDDASRTRRDPVRHRVHVATWIAANPLARRAHHDVRNAVRKGTLVRQPCEVCGRPAHGHHDDYSRPLAVRWLCPKHHREEHRAEAQRSPANVRTAPEVHP